MIGCAHSFLCVISSQAAVQTPLLADEPKGALNWLIWNGIRCGREPCHVAPMLFIIYLVWTAFFSLAGYGKTAVREPPRRVSVE